MGGKKANWSKRREMYSIRFNKNFKNIYSEKNRDQVGKKDPPQQYQQQMSKY